MNNLSRKTLSEGSGTNTKGPKRENPEQCLTIYTVERKDSNSGSDGDYSFEYYHSAFNDSVPNVIPFGYERKIGYMEKSSQVTIAEDQLLNTRPSTAKSDGKEGIKTLNLCSAGYGNNIGDETSDPSLFLKAISIPGGHHSNM